MPDLDQTRAAGAGISGATARTPSRRSVLRAAAGAGVAGIAATALSSLTGAPSAAASGLPADARATPGREPRSEPVIVHVRDAAAGELDLFRGTTVTRVHDQALAARIVRASR